MAKKKFTFDLKIIKNFLICDEQGCSLQAKYKAPKNRDLSEYYFFCLKHVQSYNLAWDYYQGMSIQEVEQSRKDDATWNRATSSFCGKPLVRRFSYANPLFESVDFSKKVKKSITDDIPVEVQKALRIFSLRFPLTLSQLKTCYYRLAKQYHPDAKSNLQNQEAKTKEEFLKTINHAYGVLKAFLLHRT